MQGLGGAGGVALPFRYSTLSGAGRTAVLSTGFDVNVQVKAEAACGGTQARTQARLDTVWGST